MNTEIEPQLLRALKRKKNFAIQGIGSSMGWLIRNGDIVLVQKKKHQALRVNDIVVVQTHKKFVAHRVIYKTKSYLVTRGDANTFSDGKIRKRQIIGAVRTIKRNGKEIDVENIYLIQSSYYFSEITEIIREFTRNSIVYVILKGLPLHLYYEREHPRRIYADVDFLVKKKQVDTASKALNKLGFILQKQSLSEIHDKLNNHHIEATYTKHINGWHITVDLHAEPAFLMTQLGSMNLLYPDRLREPLADDLLTHSQTVTLFGNKIRLLSPPYLFIYLCLHFFHHNFQGVFRLDLISRVVKKMSFSSRQQAEIGTIIKKYKLEKYMFPALRLLQHYFPETKQKTKRIYSAINPTANYLPAGRQGQLLTTLTPSIFNDEGRIEGGIRRFIMNFLASPVPIWKRIFVFFQPSVLFSVWWVLWRRISFF